MGPISCVQLFSEERGVSNTGANRKPSRGEKGVVGGAPSAGMCDWCERPLTKSIDVYWIAGTAGFDSKGEPYIGAMTRMLMCRRCSPGFSRGLRAAWSRESDRIAGRNKDSMPDLRTRGKSTESHGNLDDLSVPHDAQDNRVAGSERSDTHDKG